MHDSIQGVMKFGIKPFYLVFTIHLFCFCNNPNKAPTNVKMSSSIFSLDSISFLKNIYADDSSVTCKNAQVDSFFGDKILYLLLNCNLRNKSKDTIIVFTGTKFSYFPCLNALQLKADTIFPYFARCFEMAEVRFDSIYPNEKKMYYIPFSAFPDIENGNALYAEISFNAYKLSTQKKTKTIYYDGGKYNDTVMYRHPFLLYLNLKNNTVKIVDSTYQQVFQELKSRKYIEI